MDLRDWYRGLWSARYLLARITTLPLDSAFVHSVLAEDDAGPGSDASVGEWPPKNLWEIPVADSMRDVGVLVSGADLI